MLRHLLAGSSLIVLAAAAQIGTASATTIFDLDPNGMSFGNVLVGKSASGQVEVTGLSFFSTVNGSFSNPGAPFSGNATNFQVGWHDTAKDTITFAPTVRGSASGSVNVTGSTGGFFGGSTQTGSVAVSGKGVAPVESVTGNSPNYVLVGKTGAASITVANTGDGNKSGLGSVSNLKGTVGSASGAFSGSGGSVNLQDSKSSSFSYSFAPTTRGSASTTVTSNFSNGSADGRNQSATVKTTLASQGVAAVNNVAVGSAPVTRIGTTGSAGLTVSNVGDGNLSGLGDVSNLHGSVGSSSGLFSGAGGSVNLQDGGSKGFSYAFTPTSHAASAQSILASFTNGSSDGKNQAQSVTATLQGRGVGPTYASSVAPGDTLDFGKVQAGKTGVLDLVLSNISTDIAPGNLTWLSLLNVSLTGPGAAAFSLDSAFVSAVLLEGDLFDLKLDFSSLKAGLFNADLTIGTDQNAAFGANGMSFTYHLQGQAVPEPASLAILGAGALMLLGARRRRVAA
jgi:hypothetical protein